MRFPRLRGRRDCEATGGGGSGWGHACLGVAPSFAGTLAFVVLLAELVQQRLRPSVEQMGQVVLLDGDDPAQGEPVGRAVKDLLFFSSLLLRSRAPRPAPVLPRCPLARRLLALGLQVVSFGRGGLCQAVRQALLGGGALLTNGGASGSGGRGGVVVAAGGGSDKHDLKVLYGQGLQRLVAPVHQQRGSSKTGETEDVRWPQAKSFRLTTRRVDFSGGCRQKESGLLCCSSFAQHHLTGDWRRKD